MAVNFEIPFKTRRSLSYLPPPHDRNFVFRLRLISFTLTARPCHVFREFPFVFALAHLERAEFAFGFHFSILLSAFPPSFLFLPFSFFSFLIKIF